MSGNEIRNPRLRELAGVVEAARARAKQVAAGLTPAQPGWRPAPGRWGVGHCLEHPIITHERMAGPARAALTKIRAMGRAPSDGLDVTAAKITSPMSRLIRYHVGDALTITAVHLPRHLDQAERVKAERQFPAT